MVTIRIAKEIIQRLISELQENGFNPTKVVLFGSVAKGKTHEYSDIDVAIWDEKFTGCRPIDMETVVRILHAFPRLELHTFNSAETSEDNPFIEEIERNGIVINLTNQLPALSN